jgi:D-alanine-D-alanine ligase
MPGQHEPPRKVRLALLFGGRSPEHDVSLTSAQSVLTALDPARYEVVPVAIGRDGRWLPPETSRALLGSGNPGGDGESAALEQVAGGSLVPSADFGASVDVVFPLLHGPFGEDGTVQGLLEIMDVPYVGAGVAASAVGMDKVLMKDLFRQHDLPVLPFTVLHKRRWPDQREATLARLSEGSGLPYFVKPANMGSSIGVSRVDTPEELAPAIEQAFRYDLKVLVERGVPGYREIECAVLGNDQPDVSVPGEIVIQSRFYDYYTKYTDGEAGLVVPAAVQPETARTLQALAARAFEAIDCAGMARVDFLVSPDESAIWLNEINTIPGFTPYSMYPRLWQASGISYPELVNRLVMLGLERHRERAHLQREHGPAH